jgi:hypothetical protein
MVELYHRCNRNNLLRGYCRVPVNRKGNAETQVPGIITYNNLRW